MKTEYGLIEFPEGISLTQKQLVCIESNILEAFRTNSTDAIYYTSSMLRIFLGATLGHDIYQQAHDIVRSEKMFEESHA